jgi:hypothetical protein
MIGFSTRALARGDYRQALRMLADEDLNAVELSALRQEKLKPLVEDLDNLDLRKFRYVAFHAPSSLDPSFEAATIKLLEHVAARGWPIIIHPNAMHNTEAWAAPCYALKIWTSASRLARRPPILRGSLISCQAPLFASISAMPDKSIQP